MPSTQPPTPDTAPGLPALLLLLAVTTGLIDAVSVLGLGKVFTANMTGNIVFLGFAAVGTHGFVASLYLIAIGAFLFGAAAGGRLGNAYAPTSLPNWLMRAAIVESALLISAAVVASAGEVPHRGADRAVYVVIALTAVAMGVRNATVRKLKIADLTTTVLTLTLTGLGADLAIAGSGNTSWHRRAGSVGALLFGAALGALMVNRCGLAPPLLLAASVILIGTTAWSSQQGLRRLSDS